MASSSSSSSCSTTAIVVLMMILTTIISNYSMVVTAAAQVACPTLDKCETPMKEFSELDPGSSIFRPCCYQIKKIADPDLGTCFCSALNTYVFFEDTVSADTLNQFLTICLRSVPSNFVCASTSD